ncbi:hypothetical protein NQ314_006642 [Rhamnusium bicolor]|uniref:Crossover junction endonuclease MUS81 n=1 Tax=Rhamnusium bicolor TaxID=1586634 RepID=A0AAV8YXN0_9CUCU|nr:hypothetical protein NQ314_006642 [Rhamnusium bicolor]
MEFCFNKALQSLRKYPVPLENGNDCKILKGFGDKICQMLDKKLKDHRRKQDDHLNDTIIGNMYINKEIDDRNKPKREKTQVKYSGKISPRIQKSMEPTYPGYLTKSDIIQGQDLANSSFTKPDPGSRYTAWSSMGMLISKKFVIKRSSPAKYSLTDEGLLLARNKNKTKCKTLKKYATSDSTTSYSQEDDFVLPPDTYDIILYVDTCETGGSNVDIRDDPILAELKNHPVCYEVKNLKVGDYIWICRDRTTKKELVLPYIIERKRIDDFAKSIKDGRYHEQKFRLKKSGIQNITYLIEKYGNNQYVGLPLKTLLSCSKENLTEICLNDDLIPLMTFKEFNRSSSKNKPLKVSDLFVKMLIQIKGMSVDRAIAIVQQYPTPTILRKAYEDNTGIKGEKLLAQIQFGDYKKTIGPVLSKTVYQLFTMQTF